MRSLILLVILMTVCIPVVAIEPAERLTLSFSEAFNYMSALGRMRHLAHIATGKWKTPAESRDYFEGFLPKNFDGKTKEEFVVGIAFSYYRREIPYDEALCFVGPLFAQEAGVKFQ